MRLRVRQCASRFSTAVPAHFLVTHRGSLLAASAATGAQTDICLADKRPQQTGTSLPLSSSGRGRC